MQETRVLSDEKLMRGKFPKKIFFSEHELSGTSEIFFFLLRIHLHFAKNFVRKLSKNNIPFEREFIPESNGTKFKSIAFIVFFIANIL